MWGWDHLSRPHDHKTLTSPRVHMHTEALSFRKPHWHARTFPSNTEANIGTNTSIWFSLQQRCIFVVVFNNAPPSCAASLQGLTDYAPKWSKNILWACGTACQQKPQIQGWLLRQAVINEAHERQRGLFFFFGRGDSNYAYSFTEVLDLKSLGTQRWLTSYLKGFSITITYEIHVPFCRVWVSAPTPAAVRIFSVTTFSFPAS